MPSTSVGVPGMVSQQSIGLFAPSGTSKAIVEQIAHATQAALADRAYQQMLVESGFEPDIGSDPEKYRQFMEQDIARWTPLIKAIGLKLD
jgi:tripartite-type tricarboxylate transporter receptor subunit TctC